MHFCSRKTGKKAAGEELDLSTKVHDALGGQSEMEPLPFRALRTAQYTSRSVAARWAECYRSEEGARSMLY